MILLLLTWLACAPHRDIPLTRMEQRWVARALLHGAAPTADQALIGLAVLGDPARELLPTVLARADRGDLDPTRLADALEALGPRVVPSVEAALRQSPPWTDAGLRALARLGPAGTDALIRLSRDPRVGDDAYLQLQAAIGWAQHPWVVAGERQQHPYLVPALMFTPMNLSTQRQPIIELSCALFQSNLNPGRARAQETLHRLGDGSCVLGLLVSADRGARTAAELALPRQGPMVQSAVGTVLGLLRAPPEEPGPGAAPYDADALARYLVGVVDQVPGAEEQLLALLDHGPEPTRLALYRALGATGCQPVYLQAALDAWRAAPSTELVRGARRYVQGEMRCGEDTWGRVLAMAELDLDSARVVQILLASTPAAETWILQSARDPARTQRQRVVAALSSPMPRAAETEQVLLAGLRATTDPITRQLAAEALGLSALPGAYLPNRARAPALVENLRRDPSVDVRVAAATSLSNLTRAGLGSPATLKALREAAAQDAAPQVREAATRGLPAR